MGWGFPLGVWQSVWQAKIGVAGGKGSRRGPWLCSNEGPSRGVLDSGGGTVVHGAGARPLPLPPHLVLTL